MERILASQVPISPNPRPRAPLHATLSTKGQSFRFQVLIDSGADDSFIDADVVRQLGLNTTPLEGAVEAATLDGRLLARITSRTEPVKLFISGNHQEEISLLIISSPKIPIVLGLTWLVKHNPVIDWPEARITNWSKFCHAHCLRSASPRLENSQGSTQCAADLSLVPTDYHDLGEVFSKNRASSLPPHRPYDCAIELKSGSTFPSSRLYSISKPERVAMEKYIKESLAAELIRPSSSPLGAGFFFCHQEGRFPPAMY